MGALKAAMMDIGYKAMDVGLEKASQEYAMSIEDVKACVMFANGFLGTWNEFQESQDNRLLH